jgi:GH24 family phage-related lysozyme (muramidase)
MGLSKHVIASNIEKCLWRNWESHGAHPLASFNSYDCSNAITTYCYGHVYKLTSWFYGMKNERKDELTRKIKENNSTKI